MTPPPPLRDNPTAEDVSTPFLSAFEAHSPSSDASSVSLSFHSRPSDMSVAPTLIDAIDVLDSMMTVAPHRLPTHKTKWNDVKASAANGSTILVWLLSSGLARDVEAAKELARYLIRMGGLIPTFKVQRADMLFDDSSNALYVHRGLTCLNEGLNNWLVYPGKARSTLQVMRELNEAFAKVVHVAVSTDGHFVDYTKIRGSEGWRQCLVLLSELAVSDDSDMHAAEPHVKKCCWMNLYNLLIFHAKLVLGHPTDLVKRGRFFNDAAYVIAGKKLTSVELEHDVLRRRMMPDDKRIHWMVEEKDARMHFVLNCGAWSCPPLMVLQEDQVEENLQKATENFIEDNCTVEGSKVTLSRLWKWFRSDFTPGVESDEALLEWISQRSSKEKARQLADLRDVKIKFDVYNWADNGNGSAKPDIRFMAIYDISFQKTA